MKLGRRQCNVLLIMGAVMLFFWVTRAYPGAANDLQSDPYLALGHVPIIVISRAMGVSFPSRGQRGRRAPRQ